MSKKTGNLLLINFWLVFLLTIAVAVIRISSPPPLAPPSLPLPTYPPIALLQTLINDHPVPPPVTKHPWPLPILSEESINITRQVNRCFYYVSGGPVTVTAFSNGRHRKGSAHYRLSGVDFRLHYLTKDEVVRVSDCAEVLLGERYYVLVERRPLHLHAALRLGE